MIDLNLVCFSFEECHLLPQITSSLSDILLSKIRLGKIDARIDVYRDQGRGQYNAGKIIEEYDEKDEAPTILITSVDLYIPIFTFVFGLAKLNGRTGIVSAHRLKTDFYGLPPDEALLKSRLIKEVVHELGHLLNLRHCNNYKCVMASSNTADDLDVKGEWFCKSCRTILELV